MAEVADHGSAGSIALDRQTVLVLGATGTLGKAVTRRLSERGASLTITGRRGDRLDSLANAVAGSGAEVEAVVADLRLEDQIQEIFRRSMLKWGRLDALVNCAAVGFHEPLRDGKTDSWRAMLEVNVLAAAIAAREAVRYFDPLGGGHIVQIGSTSGHRVPPGGGFYAATKFALRALIEALRMEVSESDSSVRVSLVSPGRLADGTADAGPNSSRISSELGADDVAEVVMQVLETPAHFAINDVVIRAIGQIR